MDLGSLPVVGLLFQFFDFFLQQLPAVAHGSVGLSIPIALAALTGVICERSGVVNIGLEGIMLVAAFMGWVLGVAVAGILGRGEPLLPVFGITAPLLIALVGAVLAGMALSALHAWLSISLRVDQIISGTILNIAAAGLTGYLNDIISKQSPLSAGAFTPLGLPKAIADLPLIGWLLNALLNQGPIAITTLALVVILQILLFRSRWGLRTRAVGEHPRAAETVGIDVIKLRYRNVILSGGLAALGGAYLSMESTNSFQTGMTGGRGFIGLAAMIVGRWSPIGAFLAAVLFSSTQAIGQQFSYSFPKGQLGEILRAIPSQFYDALPYVVTIIVLAGVVGRSIAPAADGQPYQRESAT